LQGYGLVKKEFNAKVHSILRALSGGTALEQAKDIQSRASSHGFDWTEISPVFDKVYEELEELKVEVEAALKKGTLGQQNQDDPQYARLTDEFGDVLFSCVNLARFINVEPQEALASTNEKFTRRFQFIEKQLYDSGHSFEDASLDDLDSAWEEAKKAGY